MGGSVGGWGGWDGWMDEQSIDVPGRPVAVCMFCFADDERDVCTLGIIVVGLGWVRWMGWKSC